MTPGDASKQGARFVATRANGDRRWCDYVFDLADREGVVLITDSWSDEYGGSGNGAVQILGTPQQRDDSTWNVGDWTLTITTEGRTPRHTRREAANYAAADILANVKI